MPGKADTVLFGGGRLYREALKRLLSGPDFLVRSEWDHLETVISHIGETQPKLLIAIGDRPTHELAQLRSAMKSGRLVVLSPRMAVPDLREALEAGVDAYLLDVMSPRALRSAILLVLQGEKVLPTQIVSMLLNGWMANGRHPAAMHDGSLLDLSSREREILGHVADGEPNKVIASQLAISEATVKVHLKAALKKIKAANRTQAAVWALRHGLRSHPGGEDGKLEQRSSN